MLCHSFAPSTWDLTMMPLTPAPVAIQCFALNTTKRAVFYEALTCRMCATPPAVHEGALGAEGAG